MSFLKAYAFKPRERLHSLPLSYIILMTTTNLW